MKQIQRNYANRKHLTSPGHYNHCGERKDTTQELLDLIIHVFEETVVNERTNERMNEQTLIIQPTRIMTTRC